MVPEQKKTNVNIVAKKGFFMPKLVFRDKSVFFVTKGFFL